MDTDKYWLSINNMKPGLNYRFTKQEAILRFFAFFERRKDYQGSVAKFLNEYMFMHRDEDDKFIEEHIETFCKVTKFLAQKVITERPAPRMPGTVLEALMIGVAANIKAIGDMSSKEAKACYAQMLSSESFSASSLAEGLSKKDKVTSRINTAIRAFKPQ